MADNLIGLGVCPVCANTKARFTVSKKSLACMTCNACNSQIFARSDSSDEKLRSFIRAQKIDPVEATPEPQPVAKTEQKPAPAKPEKSGFHWGILGAA